MIWRVGRWVVVTAAGVAVIAWVMRTESGLQDRPPDSVSVRVAQVVIAVRHQGVKQAEISADALELSLDRRLTTFKGRTRAIFYSGGEPSLTATGSRIVFDRSRRALTVDGGVRITSPRGETLTARRAAWDAESQVVHLDGHVELTFPTGRSRR